MNKQVADKLKELEAQIDTCENRLIDARQAQREAQRAVESIEFERETLTLRLRMVLKVGLEQEPTDA